MENNYICLKFDNFQIFENFVTLDPLSDAIIPIVYTADKFVAAIRAVFVNKSITELQELKLSYELTKRAVVLDPEPLTMLRPTFLTVVLQLGGEGGVTFKLQQEAYQDALKLDVYIGNGEEEDEKEWLERFHATTVENGWVEHDWQTQEEFRADMAQLRRGVASCGEKTFWEFTSNDFQENRRKNLGLVLAFEYSNTNES